MAPTTPKGEPVQLVAGDSWLWEQSYPEYPIAEGWALSYAIAGISKLDTVSAEVVGSSTATWTVTLAPSRTAQLTAGTYQLDGYMTGSGSYAGRRYRVYSGKLVVEANAATAVDGELQSDAEVQLAAVEAVIAGRISDDVQEVTIGGRSVVLIPIRELIGIRSVLRRQVWRERNPGASGPTSYVTFNGLR